MRLLAWIEHNPAKQYHVATFFTIVQMPHANIVLTQARVHAYMRACTLEQNSARVLHSWLEANRSWQTEDDSQTRGQVQVTPSR